MSDMITLHHLEYSQSFRILWLLEELGVDYDLKKYKRDSQSRLAPDEYKALSPLGTAPVITDGELLLAESSAIIDYIMDRYPNETLQPSPRAWNRADYLFWFHAAQGSMMPLALMEAIFGMIVKRAPGLISMLLKPVFAKAAEGFIEPRMNQLLALAEQSLGNADYFCGDELTCADINLCYPVEAAKNRGLLTNDHPFTQVWLERIYDRPAFKAALEKSGDDHIALSL